MLEHTRGMPCAETLSQHCYMWLAVSPCGANNLCPVNYLLVYFTLSPSPPLSSPLLPSLFSFVKQLTPSLVRICGVRSLLGEVEALRAQAYSQEDEEHERMLLEVGGHVPPL